MLDLLDTRERLADQITAIYEASMANDDFKLTSEQQHKCRLLQKRIFEIDSQTGRQNGLE